MTVVPHILNANGFIQEPEKRSILETLRTAANTVEACLGEQDIDVVIKSKKNACSEDLKIHGSASPDAYTVFITLDPKYTNHADADWQRLLAKTVAHEFHHCKRWRKVRCGDFLKATLVSEGLAQVFELEMGHDISNYSQCLTDNELKDVSERARGHISKNEPYSHAHWFYGADPKQFKRWSGYSLGFAIVSAWLKDNRKTASQAVNIPTDEILKPWLERGEEYLLPRQTKELLLSESHPNRPATKSAATEKKQLG